MMRVFLIAVLLGLKGIVLCGPLCYQCSRIPYPRDCDIITWCGDSEMCVIDKFVTDAGVVLYSSGCRSTSRCLLTPHDAINQPAEDAAKQTTPTMIATVMNEADDSGNDDILLCDSCCGADFCNSQGCGAPGLPAREDRGPVCFSCYQHIQPGTCDRLQLCDKDHQCYVLPLPSTFDVIYTSGCTPKSQCSSLHSHNPHLIGRRGVTSGCSSCCNDDYCNMNCTWTEPTTVLPPIVHSSTTVVPSVGQTSTLQTSTSTTTGVTSSPSSIVSTSQPITQVSCQHAGYHWLPTLSLCYRSHSDHALSWFAARLQCRREGGDLLIIRTQEVLEQLWKADNVHDDQYWIGATDLVNEDYWRWIDGSQINRTIFLPSEPNNVHGNENCATIRHSSGVLGLNDYDCQLHCNYVCQIEHTRVEQSPCINSDYSYDIGTGKCYKPVTHTETWNHARHICRSKHGDLIMFKNRAESDAIMETLEYNYLYFIGATDREHEDHFRWLNGVTLSSDLPWQHGQPDDHQHEDCLAIDRRHHDSGFNDRDCSNLHYYICQETCTTPGYTLSSDGLCYKVFDTQLAWNDARQQCFLDDADLVILDTSAKFTYLQAQLQKQYPSGFDGYWIGAYTRLHGSRTWVTGETFHTSSDYWHQHEPSGSQEHCIGLTHTTSEQKYLLSSLNCDNVKMKFICQKLW